MALDSGEVRLAPFGHVYVAPVGSTLPTDVTTPFNASWLELGYLDEDGVSVTPSVDVNDIRAWQSATPVKTSITSIDLECSFNMIQVNQASTGLFFFGESWTAGGGVATLTVSSNPTLDERALAIEWTDDENNTNRLLLPRGLVTDREAMQLQRAEATAFGVTFRALDYNGTLAVILSDNPSLVAS